MTSSLFNGQVRQLGTFEEASTYPRRPYSALLGCRLERRLKFVGHLHSQRSKLQYGAETAA
jgi:hypothetical protein